MEQHRVGNTEADRGFSLLAQCDQGKSQGIPSVSPSFFFVLFCILDSGAVAGAVEAPQSPQVSRGAVEQVLRDVQVCPKKTWING